MPPTKKPSSRPEGEIVRAIREPDLSILEDLEKEWKFWAKHNSTKGDRAVAAGKARHIRAIIDHIDSLEAMNYRIAKLSEPFEARCSSCHGTSFYKRTADGIEFIHHCHPKDCRACGHIHAPGYQPVAPPVDAPPSVPRRMQANPSSWGSGYHWAEHDERTACAYRAPLCQPVAVPLPPAQAEPRKMADCPDHHSKDRRGWHLESPMCEVAGCVQLREATAFPPAQAHPTVDGAEPSRTYLIQWVHRKDSEHGLIHWGGRRISVRDELGGCFSVRELTPDEIRRLEGR